MVDPPPHVHLPPSVPSPIPPSSSSFPTTSLSKPRSDLLPSSSPQISDQPLLSSDPPPHPPPPPPPPRSATANPALPLPAQSSDLSLNLLSDLPDPTLQSSSAAGALDLVPPPPQPPIRTQPSSSTINPDLQLHHKTHQNPILAPPTSNTLPTRLKPTSNLSGPSSSLHQLSYAQVARGPRGPGFVRSHASDVESFARLPRTGVNVVCGSRDGLPSFSFVNSDLPKVEGLYSKALVMKFHGGRPSLEASHKEISSWGIEQPFSIGPLSSRSFLLRFQDEKDLLKVLSRPSSTLITFAYRVFRWHNLCHLREDSCLAPVWITLPRLPLQCFIPEFLESVANKIGRFLCLDKATATLARPSAARLCVEIDLRKPPTQFIWIGLFDGFKQQILYEKLPKFCNGCQIQGHTLMECSKRSLDNPEVQAMDRNQHTSGSMPTVRQNATTKQNPANLHNYHPPPPPAQTSTPTHSSIPIEAANPSRSTLHQNLSSHQPDAIPPPPQPNSTSKQPDQLSKSLHPPSNTKVTTSTNNPNIQHQPFKPATPHKPPVTSSLNKHNKQKRKSVAFVTPQTNLEANQEFWEAVNRQVAIIEQARLKAPVVDTGTSPISSFSSEAPTPFPAQVEAQDTSSSNDSDSGSSVAPDSQPNSPINSLQDAQNPYDNLRSSSFDSEGEEPTIEPSPFQGHNTDDMLLHKPQSSKRNKRHPDQPLKVQLRVRKDPNLSTLC